MPRYVAYLRGVSPLNAKMSELKACFEKAGFTNVKTVLSSGNVVFDSPKASESELERKIEKAMAKHLTRSFLTLVRSVESLQKLIDQDEFQKFKLETHSKKVITFVSEKPSSKLPRLPIEKDGASILKVEGREVYSAYVPGPKGPVFMKLLESTFGKDITTRTWDTVKKTAKA